MESMIVEVGWATYQLLIWRCVVPGIEERADLRDVGGEQTRPVGLELRDGRGRKRLRQSAGSVGLIVQNVERMIHEVRSDIRIVYDDRNSMLRQMISGADTRQHQQLRGAERARRQNHFSFRSDEPRPATPYHKNPCAAPVFDSHALNECVV